MKKISVLSLSMVLAAGSAFAAQNVANTSQKGSLLMFPHIDTDPEAGGDTIVEVSNDGNSTVHVQCSYVNERKGRVAFDFFLTPKQTASWDVGTQAGDKAAPPPWPTDGSYWPGNNRKGELICFAVDQPSLNQIAYNHLHGTATVVYTNDSDARQSRQGFRYNSWSFVARAAGGGAAADNTIQGPPGKLFLTGGGAGTYDACPAYNVATFMPNGATLGNLTALDNDLYVIGCNQDLRQDFSLHLTKLQFSVWNSNENSFHSSWACVDSVNYVPLSSQDFANNAPAITNPSNFDFSTLTTQNARFTVKGAASTQCPGSENVGLLGVLTTSASIGTPAGGEDSELGSTTQGAGAAPGGVLWDPADQVQTRPR